MPGSFGNCWAFCCAVWATTGMSAAGKNQNVGGVLTQIICVSWSEGLNHR